MRTIGNIYDILFIAYSSIINTVGILACHTLYFFSPYHYNELSPYLCTIFGVQLIKAITDIRLSHKFKFCELTRFNSWCYLLICLSYMLMYYMNTPDLYMVVTQSILALIGVVSFFYLYIRKHPDCPISTWIKTKKKVILIFGRFVRLFAINGLDCEKALNELKIEQYKKHLTNGKI